MPDRRPTPPPPGKARPRRGALVAGVVVAVLAFVFIRSRQGAAAPAEQYAPIGSAVGGAVDPGYSSMPSYADLTAARLDALELAIVDLQGGGVIPGPGYPTDPNIDPGEAPIGGAPVATPEQGPSGQVPPAAPGNAVVSGESTVPGSYWTIGGQRTRLTPATRDALVRELRSKGTDPLEWAASHPAAAKAVGLAPPSTARSGPGKGGAAAPGQSRQVGGPVAGGPRSAGGGGTGPRPDPPPRPRRVVKPKAKGGRP